MLVKRQPNIGIVKRLALRADAADGRLLEELVPRGNALVPQPPLRGTPDSIEKEKRRFNHVTMGAIIPHSALASQGITRNSLEPYVSGQITHNPKRLPRYAHRNP